MTLLEQVLDANGGLKRWRELQRVSVRMSIDGALFARKGKSGALANVVVEGHTGEQFLRFTGFPSPSKRGVYRPDRVAVEALDGAELEARDGPRAAFAGHTEATPWDDLHLLYFAGYTNWNYLTTPFLLTYPGVATEELGPWEQDGETWSRLKVEFPPDIVTHSPEQVFYFDEEGLQRRMDYRALDAGGASIALYSWEHKDFSGIVVPTLRRALRMEPDGSAASGPAFLNVEIFDASFE